MYAGVSQSHLFVKHSLLTPLAIACVCVFCCPTCSLLKKTRVSLSAISTAAVNTSAVATASLAEKGAKLHNTYSGGGMTGFVLDLPDTLDEQDAISKLNADDEVVKVVPDTWVGIAGAAGMQHGSKLAANVVYCFPCTTGQQQQQFQTIHQHPVSHVAMGRV